MEKLAIIALVCSWSFFLGFFIARITGSDSKKHNKIESILKRQEGILSSYEIGNSKSELTQSEILELLTYFRETIHAIRNA